MKREDVKKILGELPEDKLNALMDLYGASVNSSKSELETLRAEKVANAKTIEEANKKIASFDGKNVDEIKKLADEWKSKYETAEKQKGEEIAKITRSSAVEIELSKVKVRNPSLFKKALDESKIEYKDGKLVGFEEQVNALKKTDAYLFIDETPNPSVLGGKPNLPNATGISDAERMLRKAAGLPENPAK